MCSNSIVKHLIKTLYPSIGLGVKKGRVSCGPLYLVNGKWTAFIWRLYPKRCTIYASHSPIHIHIHTPRAIGCHARYHQLVRSNWGLGVLLRDTLTCPDTSTRPGWDRTSSPPTARRQLLPPELYHPIVHGSG